MKKLFQLVGFITVDGIETVMKQLDATEKKARNAIKPIKKFGLQTAAISKELTTKFTVPLVAAGGAVVKFGADFDKAMTNSLAIMGNVSDDMHNKMEKTARDVAKTTTHSAKEAAESYFFLASAGLDAAQSMKALPKVAKFAQAGNFDLSLATSLLTDAQSALGLKVKDATKNMENMVRVSDLLVGANTLADATTQQFAEALSNRAGAALKQLKKPMEEGVAILAVFAEQGIKGSEAGTRLDIVLRDMQKALINNEQAFKEAGIAVFDANDKMRNTADVLEDMEKHFETLSDKQKRASLMTLGFTDRSVAATIALLGTSEQIKENQARLEEMGGITEKVSEKQLKSFWTQLGLVKDRLIDIAIEFSNTLLPIITDSVIPVMEALIGKLTSLAKWFTSLPKWVQKTIIGFAAFVAITGPVLFVIGKLMTSITLVITVIKAAKLAMIALNVVMSANPFGAVATAVGVLVVGITAAYKAVRKLRLEHKKIEADSIATQKRMKEQLAIHLDILDTRNAINKAEKEGLDLVDTGKFIGNMRQAKEELVKLEAQQRKLLGLPPLEVDGADEYAEILKTINKETVKTTKASTDWLMKLKEQTATEVELIELKRKVDKEAAIEAKASKEELRALDKFYDNELAAYWSKEADRVAKELDTKKETINAKRKAELDYLTSIKIAQAELTGDTKIALKLREEAEIKAAEDSLTREEELMEAKKAIHEKYNVEYEKLREKRSKAEQIGDEIDKKWREFLADDRVQLTISMFNQLLSLTQQHTQNEIEILDRKREKDIQNVLDTITDKEQQEAEIAKINAQADKEKTKLMIKQAKAAKAANMFETIINTASGAISAYKSLAGIPYVGPALGAVAAGIVSTFGAIQLGIIAAQPLPKLAKGGWIPQTTGGRPIIAGDGDDNEAILPMKKATDEIANGIVDKIGGALLTENNRNSRPAAPQTSYRHRKPLRPIQHIWNIGTLIADDVGIKELERRQYSIRIAEQQRRGED